MGCSLKTFACLVLLVSHVGAAAAAGWDDLKKKGRDEGVVVVGTNLGNRTFRDGLAKFQKEYGIKVDLRTQRSSESDAILIRECAVNRATIDVTIGGNGDTVYKKGCFQPIKPHLVLPEVLNTKNWADNRIKFNDPKRAYLLEMISSVYGWMVYNTNMVKPAELKTAKDLLKAKFKGKIAAHDPRRGGAGQNVASYIYYKLGEKFVIDLFKGQKVAYTRSYTGIGEWVARGSYAIAIGATARGVEPFRKQGLPIAVVQLDDIAYVAGSVGILRYTKGAPHPNAAVVFMNWLLTKEGQEFFSKATHEPSRRTDVSKKDVPSYLIPKPGVKYFDSYEYTFNFEMHPKIKKKLVKVLGRR